MRVAKMTRTTQPSWRVSSPLITSRRCSRRRRPRTTWYEPTRTSTRISSGSASAYASWLGLVPSEHSSEQHVSKGSITKCGNPLCRRLLVEASWHYARIGDKRKTAPSSEVPLSIESRAAKAIKRLVKQRSRFAAKGKPPVIANTATAREVACFVRAIGCEAEEPSFRMCLVKVSSTKSAS